MTLGEVLKDRGLSGAAMKKALQTGKVWVRGVPTADAGRDVAPAEVEIRERAPRIVVGRDPAVIYRDDHLAVVWKPSGLLSVAAPKRGSEDNLVSLLARVFGEARPVHRLDEPTSGLMMVALTELAQNAFKRLLEQRTVERRYLALVHGHFPAAWTRIDAPLGRHEHTGRRAVVRDGLASVTHARGIENLPRGVCLVEARLESGRTHQVRIHLAHTGHPVLADPLYGRRGDRSLRRVALHAWRLGFDHPLRDGHLEFEAVLADDLEKHRRWLIREHKKR
ncbi:MAG TPA: RluA family pseudouridine synthase [Myxococcota bacterium]|nr:RluA family pseudouridine synthase [Myxococcota bacterium]